MLITYLLASCATPITPFEKLSSITNPNSPTWKETFTLFLQSGVPPPELRAQWSVLTSDCCALNYITDLAAGGNIVSLAQVADEQAAYLSTRMGESLSEKIPVIFVQRVLGNGGFAGNAIYVSYLDSDHLGNATAIVLHHEFVHWFDALAGGDLRPTIFQEGLAVYLSGGYFKPEPLNPRAASLLELGWFIPLRELADDSCPQQHEIGYMEATALVGYRVESYGWEAFDAFYRDLHTTPDGRESQAIDSALQEHFGITFTEFEESYLEFLRGQTIPTNVRDDLCLSVQFYETIHRYQQAFNPSSYFMTTWLLDYKVMSQRGIVAGFLRYPSGMDNHLIEAMLVNADRALRDGEYEQAGRTLKGVNVLLDVLTAGE